MKDNTITMNTNTQREDFKTQWQRRQQWQEQAEKSAPNNETLLRWAEMAQQASAAPNADVIPFPARHHNRWIPYAAAASIVIGVAAIGLNRQDETNDTLPVAKEVKVGGQTVRFLCNNGCSAQDIILSASEVIK
jgi:hypothetical protein